jgi:hypothetical protein
VRRKRDILLFGFAIWGHVTEFFDPGTTSDGVSGFREFRGGKGDITFCLGSWASAGSQREFQAHAARGFLLPAFTSERTERSALVRSAASSASFPLVVVIVVEYMLPRVAAIQNVIANPSYGSSCGSWHTAMLP